ncbi:hypothetical protein A2130_02195 [Candidatus Woesebacteria bacterium GWC2_33_12]|uniref:Uncharacterized protein n=1 Tax=Candidatus Woesebacteria bacterium GW2011_GWB1_33_22 TaxID=1618566 RepID=A0A0F9ZIL7_9BACT|nr:MAG: hypothetical protein UR29_C0014G0026 [Candidatus Woesebacteria bacterium GW2011_GWC2_33_12]KKP41599.1 MAG: hypothetical protein UR33_C0012G0025 [Candidatus Woesebacteria bacterium GW2011_GWA2_33_20]KKP44053.1 MAG: hypothetical protein UR35_C0012G0010 [Candidatus Woesebacteria bacterium GW2011_GWB1_33_22]KKP45714.1 MAG: hypothetical protein UR37_C0015G0010 [Microgenomates group bacterium GW2011_GWC1_33_28]KKP49576.1 MAG: hypothetical protein UR41_C0013G0010 [Candidatus Woesebacteria bact
MVIIKTQCYSKNEIEKLKEEFEFYIKTVIDIQNKTCIAGMNMHYDGEKTLLDQGSSQMNLWGGGIDLETKKIDFNSFINIRPNQGNDSNEIQDSNIRNNFKTLMEFFFKEII